MKERILVVFACVMIVTTGVIAQNNKDAQVMGDGYTYSLEAPSQWVSDAEKAEQHKLNAVFYPEGKSWESSDAVIYSSVSMLDDGKRETIYDVIDFDINMYKLSTPDVKIEDGKKISVANGRNSAKVIHLISVEQGSYEAVAYIPQGGVVPFVVLSANTMEDFEKSLGQFEELVSSYNFRHNVNVVKK